MDANNPLMPNKGPLVKDITDGAQVDGIFLVKTMTKSETKTGNPYLMLTLVDKSGEIAARVWDNAESLAEHCPAGGFVRIAALAQAYRDVVQLKITTLAAVSAESVDLALFLPVTNRDLPAMAVEFLALIDSVEDAPLKKLLGLFFHDAEFFPKFCQAPAAKHMHHAYIGGLIEHTLGVMRLCDAVCRLYPGIDRSLLLAGAALHDLAKTREFSFERLPFDYTDEGRLAGHLVMGVSMIGEKIRQIDGFPVTTAQLLEHLILSHHGRHEFGSPILPMTMEAFALHFLDDLDAKENYFRRLGDKRADAEEEYGWSDYQRTLERFLLVKKTPPPEDHPPADMPCQEESKDTKKALTPDAAPQKNASAPEKEAPTKATRKPVADSRQPTLF